MASTAIGCVRPDHLRPSSVLEPLARGETADTALITGPTGSGKTCIAKFTEGTPPEDIDALTPHQRAVYDAIEDHGEIAPGGLYQKYRQRVEDPKADRTIRNYLDELERYNFATAGGATPDRVYRRVGRDTDPE